MRNFESYNFDIAPVEYQQAYGEQLQKMFELFGEYGVDARLVGSLGRAAALGEPVYNFRDEFGAVRDVDIVILHHEDIPESQQVIETAKARIYPLSFDEHFSTQISFSATAATIHYRAIQQPVDPVVFAPKQGNLNGLSVPTLDANTLFHMTVLGGFLRPKDKLNISAYAEKLRKRNDILPEELYKPFHNLDEERRQKYHSEHTLAQLRSDYHTFVPISVRKKMSGFTVPLWELLNKK